ncbi:glycosyltransferase 25 family member [Calliphora vicina]|uniref:glycosyltransferase 25 family member n=1 Tax=Calliphora vicina TaxID=7373 RepID=UPI00325BE874
MKILWFLLISSSVLWAYGQDESPAETTLEDLQKSLPVDLKNEEPTVMVALMVRNKAHVLPLFLSYLERQDYPKKRMSLWIQSDFNTDDSLHILTEWLLNVEPLYHSVHKVLDASTQRHQNESSPFDWPRARFDHLISLKEQAMRDAKQIWADYIFYLDADVLLTEAHTLTHLVELRLPIVAPMLLSEGLYSNFWCGMSSDYYYLRTDLYQDIYNVNREGIFQVPMVHSAVLVSLTYKGSNYLTFDRDQFLAQQENDLEYMATLGPQCRLYDGPVDDIIVFAISANCSQIPLFITNEIPFGYILQPLEPSDNVSQDYKQLTNIQANIIHDLGGIIEVKEYFKKFEREEKKQKLSLDHIYMINLERRPERREKMESLFKVLALDVEYFPAVDGQKLNHDLLKEMGVKFLPGYEDPYHHRQMTMGEIGCFLSHYKIWEKIVENQQEQVLILEDDIRFEPYFKEKAIDVMEQIRNVIEYDLVYFGRKRLKEESEPWVANTENLVHVGYSYWTLGYVISLKGAQKLLAAKPLENLIPVDEFLPVMFNRHPNKTWANAFPQRDLLAFSASPLLLYPTHYTGDYGYISDTEDSVEINPTAASGQQAQLKSDREKEYFREPRLDSPPMELKDPQFEAAANVKTHEEL